MRIAIVGGGLAGCECAHTLAVCAPQVEVTLFEMKPKRFSPAHQSEDLAELVCSNSLRSDEPGTAVGLLKEEMESLGSLIIAAARRTRTPAGKALAVDRGLFSRFITEALESLGSLNIVRQEIKSLKDPLLAGFDILVLAVGPLASEEIAAEISRITGREGLFFYDAIAPIVLAESLNMDKIFQASRWKEDEEGDYLNCPFSKDEYLAFVSELLAADKVPAREFEDRIHFEGCLPIEIMAERGEMTLAFGPMRPVGLTDPETGQRPFAVVQLRRENLDGTMYNLVGFQTKLRHGEQTRIFRMIPGLERAEFARLGSIHRNTFVLAPEVLTPELRLKNVSFSAPEIYLAGQITGVEGYVESAASGLWLGHYLSFKAKGLELPAPPGETVLGGLMGHLRMPNKKFQPMNATFGLTPPVTQRMKKDKRREFYATRGRAAWKEWSDKYFGTEFSSVASSRV